MARLRILKPEFFHDRKMAQHGPVCALVYQALWCMADDGGTAPCDPERIKGEMFTYWTDVGLPQIYSSLNTLLLAERISCFLAGDEVYAVIRNFGKHQLVHNPSKFRHPQEGQEVTRFPTAALPQDGGSPTAVLRNQSKAKQTKPKQNIAAPSGLDTGVPKGPPGNPPPGNWAWKWAQVWHDQLGDTTVSVGRVGSWCKPVVEEHGEERAFPWWVAFCTYRPHMRFGDPDKLDMNYTDPKVGPEEFARRPLTWRDMCEKNTIPS